MRNGRPPSPAGPRAVWAYGWTSRPAVPSRERVSARPASSWIRSRSGSRWLRARGFPGCYARWPELPRRVAGRADLGVSRDLREPRRGPTGEVLDPNGIPLSTGGCCRFAPAVAYGQNYLVVWAHPGDTTTSIRGTRVDSAGTVIDPAGIPIAEDPLWHWDPAVASNGSDFLVAWKDDDLSTGQIDAARVTADGTVLDPNGIHISAAGSVNYPAVAWDGTNYFVVWQDSSTGQTTFTALGSLPEGPCSIPRGFRSLPGVSPGRRPRSRSTGSTTWSPGLPTMCDSRAWTRRGSSSIRVEFRSRGRRLRPHRTFRSGRRTTSWSGSTDGATGTSMPRA